MSFAYIGLLALVAATPILLFFNNLIVAGTIQLYVAIGTTIVAIKIRPGEARHFLKLICIPAALGAIPLLWLLVQLLPLPIDGLSRSIWDSAASALGTSISARISIDPGLTLIALCSYATIIGVVFVAAAVSIDRQHAERLFLALCSATAVICLIPLASQFGGLTFLDKLSAGGSPVTIMTASIIGLILFSANVIMIVERYEIHSYRHDLLSQLLIPIGIRIAGFLVCAFPLVSGDTNYAIFATGCGLATIVIIYVVRRISLGSRTALAIMSVAIAAASVVIIPNGHPASEDMSLRYMIGAKSDIVQLESRMIGEVGLAGSGAGTLSAISNLYGMHESSGVAVPSTFAAQIAVELGRPALWIVVALACAVIFMCARGAFNRGRDFLYSLTGAGVGVAMVLNSFSNAGLTNPAISLLVAVTLGLAFAQSISRTL